MTHLELLCGARTFNLCRMTENTVYITTFKISSPAPRVLPSLESMKGCTFFAINLIIEIGFWSVILAPTYLAVIRMQMS